MNNNIDMTNRIIDLTPVMEDSVVKGIKRLDDPLIASTRIATAMGRHFGTLTDDQVADGVVRIMKWKMMI